MRKGRREQTLEHGMMAEKQGFLAAFLFSIIFSIPTAYKVSVFDLCGYMSKYSRVDNPSYPSFQQQHRKLSQVLISAKFIACLMCVCVCMCVCVYIYIHVCGSACIHTHMHMANDFSQFISRPHCFLFHVVDRTSLT